MKPALFALPFLLFAFTTNLPVAFLDNAEVVKYKYGGNVTQIGPNYILPAKIGPKGGGLTLGKTGNSTCPLTILQDNCAGINGLLVEFFAQDNSELVFTGTPLDIAFIDMAVDCAISLEWVVVDDVPHPWVGIGAPMDHPSKNILNGAFSFQSYKRGYKLVFCSTSNTTTPSACKIIGIHKDKHGIRRLILTDKDPFQLVLL